MKLISEHELAKLLRDSALLAALYDAGVDTWSGFDYTDESALGIKHLKMCGKSDEEVTREYKNA